MKAPTKWETLARLRDIYLQGSDQGDYWDCNETIRIYDETFGERIGWKWESVLNELEGAGWSPPPSYRLLDWGCGSGQAVSRFLNHFEKPSEIWLHDRSPRAEQFTEAKINSSEVPIRSGVPANAMNLVVLLSHVVTELSQRTLTELRGLLREATSVIWVEPGTFKASHALVDNRELLREHFGLIAPCPHQDACGLKNHDRDWCHFFAEVPQEAHRSRDWKEFSQKLGIDLRSLPVSYLCLDKRKDTKGSNSMGRLLGRSRSYKGYTTGLICRESGVQEERFLKRDDKDLVHDLKKAGFSFHVPGTKRV